MNTEERPLLGDQLQPKTYAQCSTLPAEDVYDRFDLAQKRGILAMVSLTGLVASMSCILILLVSRLNELSTSVRQWVLYPINTSNLQRPQFNTRDCEVRNSYCQFCTVTTRP